MLYPVHHKKLSKLVFLTILITKASFALSTEEGLWLDLSVNEKLTDDNKWGYSLESQTRFLNKENYYEESILDGGIAYYVTPLLSFWGGYEWISHSPLNGEDRKNQIWEQMVWQVYENDLFIIRTRSRFEQTSMIHQPEWQNMFREKVNIYFPKIVGDNIIPVIYDEVFIALNKPEWEDNKTIEQNRIFMGLDITLSKTFFLEVGYLQQYEYGLHNTTLTNVAYIGFNFNNSGVPVSQYVR
jgi:hypothetical protein